MAEVTRFVRASLEDVFDAIADPRTYPSWLVGAKEIRSVDDRWPDVGSRFHHRVGLVGPITVADSSEVLAIDAPNRLELEVRFRPFGRAKVCFGLGDEADAGPLTRITMHETAIGMLAVARPVLDHAILSRNQVSLNALVAYLNSPPAERPAPSRT